MSKMIRLAIITTHPIQYYAPVFELLHQRQQLEIKVYYTWGEASETKFDPGFGKTISWDIPLLKGYSYTFLENTADNPGSHHYRGIVNPTLIDQINEWKPNAILIYGWAYQSHLKAIYYFKNKVPVFFRGDSTLLDEENGIKKIVKSIFLKWIYKQVDYVFYVGRNNKDYYKKYGLKENQLIFAPHAIDNERFGEEKGEETILFRRKLGIPDNNILILFAGKIEEKKSPLLLLEAFLELKKPGVHLLFLGNGILEQRVKEIAKNKNCVHFIDFQNQSSMPVAYQACDLFCLPSKGPGETWGLAVNEAMACGRAVLVSDKVGCAIDLVQKDYNGEIFKNENRNDLVNCLDKLTRSKKQLQLYGQNSKTIIKDWSFLKIAEAIEGKINEQI